MTSMLVSADTRASWNTVGCELSVWFWGDIGNVLRKYALGLFFFLWCFLFIAAVMNRESRKCCTYYVPRDTIKLKCFSNGCCKWVLFSSTELFMRQTDIWHFLPVKQELLWRKLQLSPWTFLQSSNTCYSTCLLLTYFIAFVFCLFEVFDNLAIFLCCIVVIFGILWH